MNPDRNPPPLWPPHPGHPFWCGTIDMELDCAGPAHDFHLGTISADIGLVTLVLTQVDDVAVLTFHTDAGRLLALRGEEISQFAQSTYGAENMAAGEWPTYTVP